MANGKAPNPGGGPGARRAIVVANATKSQVLATRAWVAASFSERRRGLLGRESLQAGEGLIIRPCRGVHGFGMKFPIDVAYVAGDNTVAHVMTPLVPNSLGPVVPHAAWVLELPEGVLAETGTSPGDRLSLFYRKSR